MINYITRVLGIHVLPNWLLIHILLMAAALGGVNATLFLSAVSSFVLGQHIANFPEAIALSGMIGILVFNLYKFLIKKLSFLNAFIFYYSFVTFLLILSVFLPLVSDFFSGSFLLFILWLPLTIISDQLLFSFSDKVPFSQNRQNLRRYVEASLILGTVVFSLGIALLSYLDVKPFVLIVILPLLAFIIFEAILIFKRLKIQPREKDPDEKIESIISFLSDIPLKYKIFLVSAFVFFSVLNLEFVDFSFLSVLSGGYSGYRDMVPFLGVFYAAIMMVNILLKLFVYQNLIKTFRLNMALFLSPVFMILMLTGINILMILPRYSNLANPASFAFIAVLLIRFFAFLWRESFESQSLRIIISSLSKYAKHVISPNIINLLGLWSLLLAGLIMLLIKSVEPFSARNIFLFNSGFVLLWLGGTFPLVRNYKDTLKRIIRKISHEPDVDDSLARKNLKDRLMVTTNLSGMKYLLNYQRYYQPHNFQKTLQDIPDSVQTKLGLGELKNEFSEVVIAKKRERIQESAGKVSTQLHFYDADENSKITEIEALATSVKIKDRIRAIKMIEGTADFKYVNIMKMLLRDHDDEVKRNAIMSASSYFNPEILTELLGYINHEEFSNLVSDVLSSVGDAVVHPLGVVFHSSEIDFRTQSKIIGIVGKINSPAASNFLLNILAYPNKWLVLESVKALKRQKNPNGFSENDIVDTAINNTIGNAAWLLSISYSADEITANEPVKKAIEEEYQVTLGLLFSLLELKYGEKLIAEVKKDFLGVSDNENRELNVEILNLVLDKDLKRLLFPLLHNNQTREKIEQLKRMFPISRKDVKTALKEIMNADLGLVSTWTKACAVQMFIDLDGESTSDDIVAQTFNPDPLISELAFFGILKKNPNYAAGLMDRLPAHFRKKVYHDFKNGYTGEWKLLFNKVLCLQKNSYFKNVHGYQLLAFAEILHEQFIPKGSSTFLKCSEEEVLPIFIIPSGKVALVDLHNRSFRLNNFSLYGLGLYSGGITLRASADAVVYIARPDMVGSLVINHEELSDALFKYIQNSNFY